MSVDPLIGHPESTQGINPYSYVENNPLNRTDPTGEVMDQCMENGICGSVTIDGIGTISASAHQQNPSSENQKQPTSGTGGAGQDQDPTGQDPQKTVDHTKITQQQKTEAGGNKITKQQRTLAGTIYNETGSLRPQNGKDGKPDADSAESLSNAREAIGKVVLNREAAGKTGGAAPSDVSKEGKATPQYADSLAAAKKAIAAGGSETGPQHYYMRSGGLTTAEGKVTAGDQPSWAKGVVPTTSYGPFRNPVMTGDVAAGNDIYIDIYNVP
ncbi:MAG: hypothetical protein ACRD22_04440 [Terriglobia bacterium]